MRIPKLTLSAHAFGKAVLFLAGVVFIAREIKELAAEAGRFLKSIKEKI